MNIQATKLELVKAILDIESKEVIQNLITFIKNEKLDFWDNLSEIEQQEIQRGIEQLNNGERVSYNEVLKKIS